MATWKIIFEIILGILSLLLGNSFWGLYKSRKYFETYIVDMDKLKEYVSIYGKDKLINEYKQNLTIYNELSQDAEAKIRKKINANIKLAGDRKDLIGAIFLFLIILLTSYFLKDYFVIINLVFFLLIKFLQINDTVAKGKVIVPIYSLIVNIYIWNQLQPDKCAIFCLKERPIFAVIYKTIISELT